MAAWLICVQNQVMEKSKRARRHRSKKQINDVLARYERSGKSQREFCDHEGISYSSFGNWFRKSKFSVNRPVRRKKDPFVELTVSAPAPGAPVARLSFSGGRSLEFFTVPDAALIKSLLEL